MSPSGGFTGVGLYQSRPAAAWRRPAGLGENEGSMIEHKEDDRLLAECDVDTFRGSGPGGQHRNVTESAVRLRHRPSGIVVTVAGHRSQHRNRREALAILRRRLAARRRIPVPRRPTRPARRAVEGRLAKKHHAGERKRGRRKVDPE